MRGKLPACSVSSVRSYCICHSYLCVTVVPWGSMVGVSMPDRVEKIFAEVLHIPPDSINESTSPDNTPKWDSTSAIDLALAIEDEFGIRFTTKEIVSMRSVALVKKVLAAKGISDV